MKIELLQSDRKGDWTVIVDGIFADHLCPDEALGVVAAAIFGGFPRHHPFLKTYEQWRHFRERICRQEGLEIVGLLTGPEWAMEHGHGNASAASMP